MFLRLIILALACALSFGVSAEEGFSRKPLFELLSGQPPNEISIKQLPIYFMIPDNFVRHRGDDSIGVLLGTQEDIDTALKTGNLLVTKSGLFRIAVSTQTGYDSRKRKFGGEEDAGVGAKMLSLGVKDFASRRVDAKGIPMLLTTLTKDTRHAVTLHVAIAVPDSLTLKISYYHPPIYTERDEKIVSYFIEGLSDEKN